MGSPGFPDALKRGNTVGVTIVADDVGVGGSGGLTDAELRATPVPVSGTVTANLSTTDNTVLDNIDADTSAIQTATEATQAALETVGGLVVNLGANNDVTVTSGAITETNSTAILADTAAMDTNLATIAGAVSTEMQVDVVGALPAGTNNIGDVDVATIAAGDNNIGNVDIASALPAGTNAIGKLAANSGVDIGDVDVTSLPALAAGTNAVGKLLAPDIDVTTHTNYAKKYYTSAGAATDGIIWSPAAGKRWHVVTMYIQVSAAATVTLEDDKSGGDEAVWKAELAANSGVIIPWGEKYPLASGEDAADLTITTSAGNVYVTVTGYEV